MEPDTQGLLGDNDGDDYSDDVVNDVINALLDDAGADAHDAPATAIQNPIVASDVVLGGANRDGTTNIETDENETDVKETVESETGSSRIATSEPEPELVYGCCFHIYRHQLDTVALALNVTLVLVCCIQSVVICLENKQAHGWCALDTKFHHHKYTDLKECKKLSYLSLYSAMVTSGVAVISVCVTWSLQLYANIRWLVVEIIAFVTSFMLAITAFVKMLFEFLVWCKNIKHNVDLETSHTITCHTAASMFDNRHPQLVSMKSTFWFSVAGLVLLVIQLLFLISLLYVLTKRIMVAKRQLQDTKQSRSRHSHDE